MSGARPRATEMVGLVLLAFTLAILIVPLPADAQAQGEIVRIGRLSPLSAEVDSLYLDPFRKGLIDLGWVEGKTFTIESRYAGGRSERLTELAAELVQQRMDLILTGSNQGALAAKKATSTIPIVMVTTGDPVADGVVKSLARPGGNITGVTALGQSLNAKRLELIEEAVPGVTRVAILTNPDSPYTPPLLREKNEMARRLGLQLPILEARDLDTLEKAFAMLFTERAGALLVQTDILFVTHRRRIVELAARSRVPTVYGDRESVDVGGLMFYGASLPSMYRDAAGYADRILKGAKPAKALGLTIPQSVIGRADQLVE